jgi:hypothetical protein
LICAALASILTLLAVPASAADRIQGRVESGGGPIAGADVSL